MKYLTILLFSISISAFSQDALLLELGQKPQLGQTIKVKIKAKKVKKKRIKYRSVRTKNSEVFASIGSYNKGAIVLPNEADEVLNHSISFRYRDLTQPNRWYDTLLILDYSGQVTANFNGKNGTDGEDGDDRGGLFLIGRDGNDGGDGEDGKQGGKGPDVIVKVSAAYDSILADTLVKAIVKNRLFERASKYLFSAKSGSLIVSARGGRGGYGGDGGDGSNGKDAKPATEKKSSKRAGCGGDGGDAGIGADGGDGGTILLEVSSSARSYVHLITLVNTGGGSGSGGSGGSAGSGGSGCEGESSGANGEEGGSRFGGKRGSDGPPPEIIYLKNELMKK